MMVEKKGISIGMYLQKEDAILDEGMVFSRVSKRAKRRLDFMAQVLKDSTGCFYKV